MRRAFFRGLSAVTALVATSLTLSPAEASDASKQERRANGAFMAALLLGEHDVNGDGRLSRAEIADTGALSFDHLDRDDDGYLNQRELRNWNRRYLRKLRRDYRREARLTHGLYNRSYIRRMQRRRARAN